MTDFQQLDAYWRAANYLTVGQIYLQDADGMHRQSVERVMAKTGRPR